MSKEVQTVLFFTLAGLAALFFLFLFLRPVMLRIYRKHNTVRSYYKTVNRLVLDNDFYLINQFHFHRPNEGEFHIDHIVFGEKYIYILSDRYYPGAIAGKEEDRKWYFYRNKRKADVVPNPMAINEQRRTKLALVTGLQPSFLIAITVVNDDCAMVPFEPQTNHNYIVSLKNLQRFIEKIESDESVEPLQEDQLSTAVRDIDQLNRNIHD